MGERRLTAAAAARYLGEREDGGPAISKKTLANWRCLGRGPEYVRAGVRILYETAALDRFIEQGRRKAKAA